MGSRVRAEAAARPGEQTTGRRTRSERRTNHGTQHSSKRNAAESFLRRYHPAMQGHRADSNHRTGLRQVRKGVQHPPAQLRHTAEGRHSMGTLRKAHLKRIRAVKDIHLQAQGRNRRSTHIL